ncbi:unnamed protein product [Symbiodinium natans]|uniref:Methyltransferase FkbM domain-containing protein n=1 Tax=Symbiodinium natans TaxID=878477 RepID=A0A812NJB9_9DINO|nr:unnamed protein product [Symbiodinium natans]
MSQKHNAALAGLAVSPSGALLPDPACWAGFRYDQCCGKAFGPAGNLECWNATFTPERCCVKERLLQASKTPCQCCNRSHLNPVGSISEVVEKLGVLVFFDALTLSAGWLRKAYPRWEPRTFSVFQRFARGTVLDVGAWIGVTAIWEANIAEHVFAVEPTPTSVCELRANLNVNPARVSRRVTIIHGALHNESGSIMILNRGPHADNRPYYGPSRPLLARVPAFTIETLLLQYPRLREVSFVKIDVEGHELALVPAMRFFFKEYKPVVFLSLHPKFIGDRLVRRVATAMRGIFPYLYEADMKTPFNTRRFTFFGSVEDHFGTDLLATWHPL